MKECSDKFKIYYFNKHSHRRLDWLLTHGQCEMRPLFAEKPYQLVATVYQATILDLFNFHETLTV